MTIRISYRDYKRGCVREVKGTYDSVTKTIEVFVDDRNAQYFKAIAMTNEEIVEKSQAMGAKDYTIEMAAADRAKIIDYLKSVYGCDETAVYSIAKYLR